MEQAPQPNPAKTNAEPESQSDFETAKNEYLESWDKLEKAYMANETGGKHVTKYDKNELGALEEDRDEKRKKFEQLQGNAEEAISEFKKETAKDLHLSPEYTAGEPSVEKEAKDETEIRVSAKEFAELKKTVAKQKAEIKKLNERLDALSPKNPIDISTAPTQKIEKIEEPEQEAPTPDLEHQHQQAAPLFEKLETLQDKDEIAKVQDEIMKIYENVDKPAEVQPASKEKQVVSREEVPTAQDLPNVNPEEYEDPIHLFIKAEDRKEMGKNEDGLEDQDLFYIAREDPHPNLERNFEGNFAEIWNHTPQEVRKRWTNDIRHKRQPYVKMEHSKKQPLNEGFIDWILKVFFG